MKSEYIIHDTTPKEVIIEQILDWMRRRTDGYDELNRDLREKLGEEWDY